MPDVTVIGLLGPVLDDGYGATRWDRWRPTVSVCQHEDLLVGRFELLYQKKFRRLVDTVITDIGSVSPETVVNPVEIEFSDPWDFEEVYGALHDYARAYEFDQEQSEYLVHITTGTHVAQICLYLLTESRLIPGKLLQTSPSDKSAPGMVHGKYSIIDLDLSKYDKLATRFHKKVKDDVSFLKSGIETLNGRFNNLIEIIENVAKNSPAPVLLMGPTGAGKSKLARRIYELKKSRRQVSGDFVEVNCATLRGDTAMSALFGHVKGAFTGAIENKPGFLGAADGGILFLDEIGELGKDEQAMLLRALEEKTFLAVGAVKESRSSFQLICGTNKDLLGEVRRGAFREDLLARINLWTFVMPGLKDRVEDIEPNIDYELDRLAETTNKRVTFNKEAKEKFLEFATSGRGLWHANFRDLNAAIVRMGTLAHGGRITADVVNDEIARLVSTWGRVGGCEDTGGIFVDGAVADGLGEIDPFEAVQLSYVIKICKGSRSLSEAGRRLFSVSRSKKKLPNDADRLSKYLSRYGLTYDMVKGF